MAATRKSILKAQNSQELIQQLQKIGLKVGPRVGQNKRTQRDKEHFCLRRYVATLAANKFWEYPCEILEGESPDFIIKFLSRQQGLEITEATTKKYQKELTNSYGKEPSAQLLDDGWVGDSPEKAWCGSVLRAIRNKVRKIASGKYQNASQHDTLIYSNHSSDIVRGGTQEYDEYAMLKDSSQKHERQWKNKAPLLGRISIIDGQNLLYDLLDQNILMELVDLRY